MNRAYTLGLGTLAVVGLTWLWHGPLGAGDRLARQIDAQARKQLDKDEMKQVQAHLQRDPLSRHLILSGPADDFQRREIVRRMELISGVAEASWDPNSLTIEVAR